jgi:hypothetical protein
MSAVAFAAPGCGDDEGRQIPAAQSTALRDQLQTIKRQIATDPCISDASLTQLESEVAALPRDLDEDVRQTLEEGIERLRTLVNQECADQPEPEEEQTGTEEETTPTETTETETDTSPTDTTPPEPEPEPEPEEDGDEEPPGGGEEPGSGGIGPGAERRGKKGRK